MTDEKKGAHRTETPSDLLNTNLGLPPLKMVLVHAENERANAVAQPVLKPRPKQSRTQEEAIAKIIEHLAKD